MLATMTSSMSNEGKLEMFNSEVFLNSAYEHQHLNTNMNMFMNRDNPDVAVVIALYI